MQSMSYQQLSDLGRTAHAEGFRWQTIIQPYQNPALLDSIPQYHVVNSCCRQSTTECGSASYSHKTTDVVLDSSDLAPEAVHSGSRDHRNDQSGLHLLLLVYFQADVAERAEPNPTHRRSIKPITSIRAHPCAPAVNPGWQMCWV
jgi:hypothetical protein